MHQLQLVSPLLPCSVVFLVLWQGLSIYLSFRFLLFSSCDLPRWQSPQYGRFSFFLLTISRSSCLGKIRWSVCISKSPRSLYVSFSRTDSRLCIYHLFISWCFLTGVWWQQVSSGLQDSSQYYSWSRQCCKLMDLDYFSNFQMFQSPFPIHWGLFQVHQLQVVSSSPAYPQFFSFLARSKYLSIFSFSGIMFPLF